MKGICSLCLRPDVNLSHSHFIPRSLYAFLRTPKYDPVWLSREAIYPTSTHTKDYVFCGACEQIFNREGENWLIPLLPILGGQFPLRERLMKQMPIVSTEQALLYATATNAEIDLSKLLHFAIGIFYRAAVHSWRGDTKKCFMQLDPGEIEALRVFLLGKTALPKTLALCVKVDSLPTVLQAVNLPYRAEDLRCHKRYLLYVPGVLFEMLIGEEAQEDMMPICINANPLRPVLIEDVPRPMRNLFREQTAHAQKTKKLNQARAEIKAMGLGIRLGG